jgi:hypothetical protein
MMALGRAASLAFIAIVEAAGVLATADEKSRFRKKEDAAGNVEAVRDAC